jgi:hypothetical protein
MPKRIAEQLELRSYQDGTSELIFWDNINGDDISAFVDKNGVMTINNKIVTLKDFINKVRETSLTKNNSAGF